MTATAGDLRTSQRARDLIAEVSTGIFVDGEWTEAASGARFDVVNPATDEVIATVADSGSEDALRAIETAGRVQKEWAGTAPRERSEILRRAYDLVMARQDEFAFIMTTEMGKPLAEAKGEVVYAAEFFRWFSEEAVRIGGDLTTTGDGKNRILVSREPVGPCVVVTPWNFPLAMGMRKIGPALAAGCAASNRASRSARSWRRRPCGRSRRSSTTQSARAPRSSAAEAGRTARDTSTRGPSSRTSRRSRIS